MDGVVIHLCLCYMCWFVWFQAKLHKLNEVLFRCLGNFSVRYTCLLHSSKTHMHGLTRHSSHIHSRIKSCYIINTSFFMWTSLLAFLYLNSSHAHHALNNMLWSATPRNCVRIVHFVSVCGILCWGKASTWRLWCMLNITIKWSHIPWFMGLIDQFSGRLPFPCSKLFPFAFSFSLCL